MARQFHRPARLDPEAAESIEGGADTAVASELAHRAAQALVGGFPAAPEDPITREAVINAVAGQGVDDVAELWADSPATTLPGALWRLFLVREWIRRDAALVGRRYATVVDLTGPDGDGALAARLDAALAEGRPVISPEELRARLDAVLAGALEGSVPALAPLLSTTSGFLAALAAGSAPEWIDDDADPLADRVTRRDSALLATADELSDAAVRARAGLLD
ncbi:hypothetical protein [Actinomyces gaoshouyii]|uniref:DNA-directed RNA polymerase subunit beta n=1 Tax=Actinomyces gaoshouyii TaxID=1960083 RepID=A0A8H9HCP0_9ACTO|nr:hypothetical protein [Actinomyces gaoshouyii]ARD42326.1 hypothetical protein B6G06_08205 [Actinomyces gaoshouyii]GGO95801.1 hypothetical protein GCM10011612_04540 [Actinomyces gaoshouyii]